MRTSFPTIWIFFIGLWSCTVYSQSAIEEQLKTCKAKAITALGQLDEQAGVVTLGTNFLPGYALSKKLIATVHELNLAAEQLTDSKDVLVKRQIVVIAQTCQELSTLNQNNTAPETINNLHEKMDACPLFTSTTILAYAAPIFVVPLETSTNNIQHDSLTYVISTIDAVLQKIALRKSKKLGVQNTKDATTQPNLLVSQEIDLRQTSNDKVKAVNSNNSPTYPITHCLASGFSCSSGMDGATALVAGGFLAAALVVDLVLNVNNRRHHQANNSRSHRRAAATLAVATVGAAGIAFATVVGTVATQSTFDPHYAAMAGLTTLAIADNIASVISTDNIDTPSQDRPRRYYLRGHGPKKVGKQAIIA